MAGRGKGKPAGAKRGGRAAKKSAGARRVVGKKPGREPAASRELAGLRRTVADLAHRLGVMEDIQAIKELRARFARMADPQPAKDEIYKLFAADGVNEYSAGGVSLGVFRGHDAIRAMHETDPLLWRFHCYVPQEISVAPDRMSAKARWNLIEAMKIPNRRNGKIDACWIMAKYDDDLVKMNGEWKFRHARMDVQIWVSHENGWAEKLTDLESYMDRLG